ncbi:MAG: capsule assembly Wzi family protein [Pelobium sp.]
MSIIVIAKLKLVKLRFSLIFSLFLVLCVPDLMAQNLTVGLANIEDYYRRSQLLNLSDSSISYTIRPLNLTLNRSLFDGIDDSSENKKQSQLNFQLLPFRFNQQLNTHHPYGWNDGSMIPSKGYESLVSAGVFFKYGPLVIQLQPEYVFASNGAFEVYPINYNGNDMPQRFGTKSYSNLNWGQSSIRLRLGPVDLGLSNENLWWGPGLRNSLLMTNTAPGFKHVTLNSNQPINTYIGSFEAQIIGGRLENSGYLFPKTDNWRYLAGLAVSYHPKWVPGVFLGFTRSFQTYQENLKKFSDYFPLFRPLQKVNDKNQDLNGSDRDDQISSVFARWALKKAHAEVYFEYGVNDHSYNLRYFLLSPEHSRAYIFGMRKLIPVKQAKDQYVQLGFEFTQLEQSIEYLIRGAGSWYTHYEIDEGHTNSGQVLGAGIGPGGNLQTFDLSWFKGYKHLGLQLERYQHNSDFYNGYLNNGTTEPWVDFSAAAVSDWNYKGFLLNAKLQGIQSVNYLWGKDNVFNLHASLGITYCFQ